MLSVKTPTGLLSRDSSGQAEVREWNQKEREGEQGGSVLKIMAVEEILMRLDGATGPSELPVKNKFAGPHPQSCSFSRSGVGCRNL